MLLKVAYNDNSEQLVSDLKEVIPEKYAFLKLEAYQEELFKERKKAFALKYTYGTRLSPFAILFDNEDKAVIAFYSEDNNCTFDKITEALDSYIVYNKIENQ